MSMPLPLLSAGPLSDKPGHAGRVPPGHRNRAGRREHGAGDGAQNQAVREGLVLV